MEKLSKWLVKKCQKTILELDKRSRSLPLMSFEYKNNLEITTYFTQEMLKKGYLAGGLVATNYAYNTKIIKKYLEEVNKVFKKISICLKNNKFH